MSHLSFQNKKIKVLHVVGGLDPGGLETLIMNIYRNIDKSKFEFHFVIFQPNKTFYLNEIQKLGGLVYTISPPNKGYKNFEIEFESLLKSLDRFDVVHSHVLHFSGFVLKISKKMGVPVRISHSHNTSDGKKASIKRSVYHYFTRYLIKKNSTHRIGCSSEACKYLFGRTNKSIYYPNAIDSSLYINNENRNYLISELNLDSNAKLIGHIGRFVSQKNQSKLIEVFNEYLHFDRNTHLILIGDGPLKQEIVKKVNEFNLEKNVHFLGLRRDIPELLGSLDIFVLPSLFEGLGIVLVEAQASGLPCIISNDIPKESDLELGLITRVSRVSSNKDWAESIKKSISNRYKNKEEILNQIRKKNYDIKDLTRKYEAIYRLSENVKGS